jgi:multidrug resistance efflux pump
MRMDRHRAGPMILWLVCLGAVLWLYRDVGGGNRVVGFAHGAEYPVAPLAPARVSNIAVDIGQAVTAGQVVATLDTTMIDEEIAVASAKRVQAEARLQAAVEEAKRQALVDERALARELSTADTRLAESRARRDEATAELGVQKLERKRIRALVDARMLDRSRLAALQARVATLTARVSSSRAAVEVATKYRDEAKSRANQPMDERVARAVAPLGAALQVMDARIRSLHEQRGRLVLRAPADGHIAAVHLRTGGVAGPREPVATIVGTAGGKVIACLVETNALDVNVGDLAKLYLRSGDGSALDGHVIGLGPIVDSLPSRCRPNVRQKAWGRDVVILLDEPASLLPGQVLDVEIARGERVAPGSAKAALQAAPTLQSVRDMVLPESLVKRSRFEPSGLVWVPQLLRYVVVSDDTGQKDLDEHAPWLFTMDRRGQVDPSPMPISGADSVNDLESITTSPGGGLYVLASQSRTRKGKRPSARRLFLHLERAVDGFKVAGQRDLFGMLEALEPSALAKLGITDLTDLDIEGMTAFGAGLLIGLKAPVDAEGRAVIWKLDRPAVLLSGGSLEEAGLALWRTVRLEVEADGKRVPGGIAELLVLPDTSLVLASTASIGDPSSQDGTLWWAPAVTGDAPLQARRIEAFSGLKPEGLALSPSPGRMIITFDRGSKTPRWAERSRPIR